MGRDPGGSLCPATAPAGFLWPGAEFGYPAFWDPGPYPISLTQVSLQSQAKPDPRAKPAGVTMPSPQTSPWVPQKHCLCGRGLLSILPDLEPRGGIGLLEFGEHDITEEADPLPAG